MATTERVSVRDPEFAAVEALVRASLPRACITEVLRVVPTAAQAAAFAALCDELTARRGAPCPVRRLFHGTSDGAARGILAEGFKVAHNLRAAYGRGTYFAASADTSKGFAPPRPADEESVMFIADVALGKVGRVGQGNDADADHDVHVDAVANPTIFATPLDAGALPRYLVTFYRDAR